MHIGTLTITLLLAEGSSLKEKRRILKGLVETARRKFNISIAEIDDLNLWRRATLGIVVVSNDSAHANRILDKVLDYFEACPEVDVGEVEIEML
ncbi:MAG TPA: DUF503 domain-containing protein [Chthonomonadales bacterium]|nr:DUF503 domain-containing protein [Chthonomonadales bacterium]